MSFAKLSYLPFFIPVLVIIIYIHLKYEKKYYRWIKEHFFYKRTKLNMISTFFYVLTLITFFIALLDLRGPVESIEGNVSEQKTLILLDASSSMMAEDVRPSRFRKSIMLARHFVKNAHGHKISIVLFSDNHKRIVPFTDDLDLLDSRLAGLDSMYDLRGGSNIIKAINESITYFKVEGSTTSPQGNLILMTDSEETISQMKLDVPEGISIAAIGIGTKKGANIPVKSSKGRFIKYKKYNGEEVISKLNEKFLESLASQLPNYKYWIVQSFNLPTDQILGFFKNEYLNKLEKASMKVRPVKGYFLIILAIIFYMIHGLFFHFKSLKVIRNLSYILALALFMNPLQSIMANDDSPVDLEQERLQRELEKYKDKYRQTGLSIEEKKYIANILSKLKEHGKAKLIYDENTPANLKNIDTQTLYNMATNELALKEYNQAIEKYLHLKDRLSNDDSTESKTIKEKVNENIKHILKKSKQDKKNQENQKKNKKNNQEKDDKKKSQNKENKKGENKDKKKNKEGKDDKKEKKDKQGSEKKNEKQSKKEELKKLENKIKQKRKQVKIPGTIKQLLNDDRELQRKFIDTSTDKKNKSQEKDW